MTSVVLFEAVNFALESSINVIVSVGPGFRLNEVSKASMDFRGGSEDVVDSVSDE